MDLGVAFVSGAVVAFDFEKQVLHFTKGPVLHRCGDFFDRSGQFWFSPAEKLREVVGIALSRERFPFCGNGRLKIADTLVGLLQPNRLRRLRLAERLQMCGVETWSKNDPVRIHPLADGLHDFLRRLQDFFPALVLPLKPGVNHVQLLLVSRLTGTR